MRPILIIDISHAKAEYIEKYKVEPKVILLPLDEFRIVREYQIANDLDKSKIYEMDMIMSPSLPGYIISEPF